MAVTQDLMLMFLLVITHESYCLCLLHACCSAPFMCSRESLGIFQSHLAWIDGATHALFSLKISQYSDKKQKEVKKGTSFKWSDRGERMLGVCREEKMEAGEEKEKEWQRDDRRSTEKEELRKRRQWEKEETVRTERSWFLLKVRTALLGVRGHSVFPVSCHCPQVTLDKNTTQLPPKWENSYPTVLIQHRGLTNLSVIVFDFPLMVSFHVPHFYYTVLRVF